MGSKYGSITQGGAMSISGGGGGIVPNQPGGAMAGSAMIQSMSIARVDSIATTQHAAGDKSTKTGSQHQPQRFHHYEAAAGLEDIHYIFVFQYR